MEHSGELNHRLGNLHNALAKQNKGHNSIWSPFSLFACFSMLGEGLSGTSYEELKSLFGFETPGKVVSDENMKRLDGLRKLSESSSEVKFKICNAIYTSKLIPVKKEYVELLAHKYHSVSKSVDMANPATLKEINDMITQATNGLLHDTLDKLDASTICLLINTIYFKGPWDMGFDVRFTRKAPFNKADGTTKEVDFMGRSKVKSAMKETSKYNYLCLPYKEKEIKFVVEMANDKILGDSVTENVVAVVKAPSIEIDVHLPKFKAKFKSELIPLLQGLHVNQIFKPSATDFKKITDVTPVYVGSVIHQAAIEVDEKGTEAAVATVVKLLLGGALGGTQPPQFNVDKPFHFHIVDSTRDVILFSGSVEVPEF